MSLEQQLEDSDRQYHAMVATIQMDAQRDIQEFKAEVRMEEERTIEAEVSTPAHEVQERYAQYVQEGIAQRRRDSRVKIQYEMEQKMLRDQSILHPHDPAD